MLTIDTTALLRFSIKKDCSIHPNLNEKNSKHTFAFELILVGIFLD